MNKQAYEQGGIMHFFEFAEKHLKECARRSGLKEGTYRAIRLYPKDPTYVITYGTGENMSSISFCLTDKHAFPAVPPIYSLAYDREEGRFYDRSYLGGDTGQVKANDLLDGKVELPLTDVFYNTVAHNNLFACFSVGRTGGLDALLEHSQVKWPKGFGKVMGRTLKDLSHIIFHGE